MRYLQFQSEIPDLIGRQNIQLLADTSPRTIAEADTEQLAGT